MLFRLEPRGHRSTFWVYASPVLALALTLIASALVFEAMGRREEAIADFRRVLSKDPNSKGSKDALKRLGVAP